MSKPMRIVAPWGFYGAGNTGDEGTLSGFAQLLAVEGIRARASIASRNPRHTARVEPAFRYFGNTRVDLRRWYAKAMGTVHAVIGGTPIQDVLGAWPLCELTPLVCKAERWKAPFVFVGCGIESLRRPESREIMSSQIVPRVRHWSVRSEKDGQRLLEYGVAAQAVTVAADVAWLIEPVSTDFGRQRLSRLGIDSNRPLIGVNLANENSCFDRHPEMAGAIAAALDRLVGERDARVIFLCAEVREEPTYDQAAARQIMSRMKRADRSVLVPNEYFAPRELMSLIACCSLTVTMRYHFCLFSALQSVPFVAICRSDKIADLCWDLEWAASLQPPFSEPEGFLRHAEELARHAAGIREKLQTAVRRMRARAVLNAAVLRGLASG